MLIVVIAIGGIIGLNIQRNHARARAQAEAEASASASASAEAAKDQAPTDTPKGQWVAVIHRNHVAFWFDSGVDDTYTTTGDYGEMTITVKDNKWCVSEVECPNHNCEQMGWDDGTNFIPITCIPNNIIICTEETAQNYLENAQ